MIILAAMLASGPVLPWVDRSWLNDRAQIEVAVAQGEGETRPLKTPMRSRPASILAPRKLGFETRISPREGIRQTVGWLRERQGAATP